MLYSFLQFAVNSILFMICMHFGMKAYDYIREKRYVLAKAKLKKNLKGFIERM